MFCFVKNIKKNAFTLAELLIALGVIGILTAIAIPIVFSLAPDQNVLMAKRAFFTTETVISNLLNDPNCYPKILSRSGLDDGLGYAKCNKYGGKDNPSKLSIDDASEKLVTLFTNELDLKGEIKKEGTKYSFTTKDGIKWTFSDFNFTANDPDSYVLLTADVNGNKDPNCGQYSASGQCSDKNRTKGFDKFTMKIFARGKIQIIDCWAVMAMKIDKKLVGKEDIDSKELLADDCSAIAGDTIKTVFVGEKEYRLINNFHYNASDSSIAANVYVYLDADGNYVYNGRTYYKQPDGTFKTSDDFVYDENLNLIGRNSNGYWFEFKGDVLVRPIEDGKYRGTGSGIYTPNANGGYNGTWDNRVYDANFNTLGKYKNNDYYAYKNGIFVKEDTNGNYISDSNKTYTKNSDGYYVNNNIYYDKDMNPIKEYYNGNWYEYKNGLFVRQIEDGVYKGHSMTYEKNDDGNYIRSDGNVYDDEFIYVGKQ